MYLKNKNVGLDELIIKLNEFKVDRYVSWGSHKEFLKYKKMQ